jgi:scavenger receptor class B protein 1
VKYGRKSGPDSFFQINNYNYEEVVPGFPTGKRECFATLNKSSEGALYPQGLNKSSVLWYFRKTLCRPVPLYYDGEIQKDTLVGYKFALHTDTYDRKENRSADCYKGFSKPLPDGLSDLSKCFYNLPMAASFPHFLDRQGEWTKKLYGLNASRELHSSYAVVQPTLGIPLEQAARSQSNLVVHDISGFKNDFMKFKNMVLPIFWLEYVSYFIIF